MQREGIDYKNVFL